MNPTPPAAIAVMQAAVDDYRLTTPADERTPEGEVRRIAEYLRGSGYAITPQRASRRSRRAALDEHQEQ